MVPVGLLFNFANFPHDPEYADRYTLYPPTFEVALAAHARSTECVDAATPVPVRGTVALPTLVVTRKLPFEVPLAEGAKETLNFVDWPPCRVNGKLSPLM